MKQYLRNYILIALLALLLPINSQATDGVDAEGISLMHVDWAQASGVKGSGIKVGIISQGIQGYQALQQLGVLPSSIFIVGNDQGSGGEGAAMLQLVYAEAPNAQLGFCAAGSVTTCAQQLAAWGANVIADDFIPNGSLYAQFSPTIDTEGVENVLTNNSGLLYFRGAGNDLNLFCLAEYNPIQTTVGGTAITAEDFGASFTKQTDLYGVYPGLAHDPYETLINPPSIGTLTVDWNDDPDPSSYSSNNVVTLYLLDANNNVITSQSSNTTSVSVSWNYGTTPVPELKAVIGVQVVNNVPLAFEVMQDVNAGDNGTENWTYATGGAAGGELGPDSNVIVTAGANATTSNPLSIYGPSSAGPYRVDFSATYDAGTRTITGYTRLSSPLLVQQPQLSAPTEVTIAGDPYFSNGTPTFSGTSATAPNAAGVAALLLSTGALPQDVLNALEQHTITSNLEPRFSNPGGWDPRWGYGLIDAYASLEQLIPLPEPTITKPSGGASITVGQSVTFNGSCTPGSGASVNGYQWNFGNGQTSTMQNPGTVTYSKTGSYTVTYTCSEILNGVTYTNGEGTSTIVDVQSATSGGGSGGGGGGAFSWIGMLLLAGLLLIQHGTRKQRAICITWLEMP